MSEENEEYTELGLHKKSVLWGVTGGISLLTVYFLTLTLANSFEHSLEQFREMGLWISLLVLGFGTQVGLYAHIRGMIKLRKHSGAATTTVTAAGGVSTASMVACCAHHLTDILPILGISAAAVFLNQYQMLFITVGVLSNLIGITLMLNIIQQHGLFTGERGILSVVMKMNMKKSFYFVCVFSFIVFVATLYKNI
jgi:hypothetical protein